MRAHIACPSYWILILVHLGLVSCSGRGARPLRIGTPVEGIMGQFDAHGLANSYMSNTRPLSESDLYRLWGEGREIAKGDEPYKKDSGLLARYRRLSEAIQIEGYRDPLPKV